MVVVLLDDWHLCPAEIQQIGFELFTYRSLNGQKVPDNVRFILAGNESSSAGAQVQLTAIRNRCWVLYTKSTPEYWIENYAENNGVLDIGIAYFNNRDHWGYFHEDESTNEQFGSPRSWTYMFNIIDYLIKSNISNNKKALQSLIPVISQGYVSRKAASSFSTYYTAFSDIDVKSILHKGIINIPDTRIEQFTYITAVTSELYSINCSNNTNLINTANGNYLNLLNTFVEEGKNLNEELCICAIKQLYNKVEVAELGLPSGGKVLTTLIKDKRTSMSLLAKLREMASKMSSNG